MTETRIEGKFYPLQISEWVGICKSLTKSQISVLYYIRSIDPYDNGVRVKASKIAEELNITKRAVNAAISVLREKRYIKLEDIEYSVKVNGGGCLCDSSSTVTSSDDSVEKGDICSSVTQNKVENVRQFNSSIQEVDSLSSDTLERKLIPTSEENFSDQKRISPFGDSVLKKEEDFSSKKMISQSEAESVVHQGFENPKTLKESKNIKNTTEQMVCVKEIFEKFYDRLKVYGIYYLVWDGEKLVLNQRMVEIQKAVFHVPLQKIEAGLRAFCAWMREAKGVRNKYKALETSILRGWEI